MRRSDLLIVVLALSLPLQASAFRFPDVPKTDPHGTAIERLSDMGVIGGNPDGTFRPTDPVNRAAMLKMLYVAADRVPQSIGKCFTDVQEKSWYEFYVCDAAANGFVQGYNGTHFKPDQPVTRAEALKLTIVILGIEEADLATSVRMYTDVAATDWHAKYFHTALVRGILPIPGQDGDTVHPNWPLERREAASYIWNALQVRTVEGPASSASSAESMSSAAERKQSSSGSVEGRSEGAIRAWEHEQEALERARQNTVEVTVPFTDRRSFDGTIPFLYQFTVNAAQTVEFITSLGAGPGVVSCRLYFIAENDIISDEYYLGFEEESQCIIRAALRPGRWQLQLQPNVGSVTYSVTGKIVAGDGHDGFVQAKLLPIGKVRTDFLDSGDMEDWYTFSVFPDATMVNGKGKKLTFKIISADTLGCLIYPLNDVDLFGFRGPQCGEVQEFQPGTYMVSIRHAEPRGVRQTYSIELK